MGPFGSNIKAENYRESGVPYLNGSNVRNFELDEAEFHYVDSEKANSLKRAIAHRGDVIVTHRGTLGQISYIPKGSKYDRYITGNSQFRLTCNQRVLPEYFVYFFHSPEGRMRLLSNASQVGVPSLARPTSTFLKLTVDVPDLPTQYQICSMLGSIQRKIATCNAINDNLEQQAFAIFRHFFVDIVDTPYKWSKGCLLDIADYLNGLAMQNFRPSDSEVGLPVLKIKELRQGSCDASSELCSPSIKPEYIIHDGDIIFSWSGSLLVDLWCGGTCGLNQHLFKVSPKAFDKWFCYLWTAHYLERFAAIAADKATTMGHIKREDLAKAEVLIPSNDDYTKISTILTPIIDLIISNRLESKKLSVFRDLLLPKLMSGEIDVSSVKL